MHTGHRQKCIWKLANPPDRSQTVKQSSSPGHTRLQATEFKHVCEKHATITQIDPLPPTPQGVLGSHVRAQRTNNAATQQPSLQLSLCRASLEQRDAHVNAVARKSDIQCAHQRHLKARGLFFGRCRIFPIKTPATVAPTQRSPGWLTPPRLLVGMSFSGS